MYVCEMISVCVYDCACVHERKREEGREAEGWLSVHVANVVVWLSVNVCEFVPNFSNGRGVSPLALEVHSRYAHTYVHTHTHARTHT